MGFGQLRDELLKVAPLDLEHVKRVNRAEAEFWKRNAGTRCDWSDQILGFDCGGQQHVYEVAFRTGDSPEANTGKDLEYMRELMQMMIEREGIPAPRPSSSVGPPGANLRSRPRPTTATSPPRACTAGSESSCTSPRTMRRSATPSRARSNLTPPRRRLRSERNIASARTGPRLNSRSRSARTEAFASRENAWRSSIRWRSSERFARGSIPRGSWATISSRRCWGSRIACPWWPSAKFSASRRSTWMRSFDWRAPPRQVGPRRVRQLARRLVRADGPRRQVHVRHVRTVDARGEGKTRRGRGGRAGAGGTDVGDGEVDRRGGPGRRLHPGSPGRRVKRWSETRREIRVRSNS